MWYNVNIKKLAINVLLPFTRKPAIIAFVKAAVTPFVFTYSNWFVYRKSVNYTLSITPQVCYLQKMLNDNFDEGMRRIKIVEPILFPVDYIYMDSENNPVYIYMDSENNPWYIRTEAEFDWLFDFIVEIPNAINITNDLDRITDLLNKHKLASMRWTIVRT